MHTKGHHVTISNIVQWRLFTVDDSKHCTRGILYKGHLVQGRAGWVLFILLAFSNTRLCRIILEINHRKYVAIKHTLRPCRPHDHPRQNTTTKPSPWKMTKSVHASHTQTKTHGLPGAHARKHPYTTHPIPTRSVKNTRNLQSIP